MFSQGENGRYNRSASPALEPLFRADRVTAYKSADTKLRSCKTPYTFNEILSVVPSNIVHTIMMPYAMYKLFCPLPLDSSYLPTLYLGIGNNIIAIHQLAIQLGVKGLTDPDKVVAEHRLNTITKNNLHINMLADFKLNPALYTIKPRPELTEDMKIAYTTLVYVARLIGMYTGEITEMYNLSNAPPLSSLPPGNSCTNPMWDANTLILAAETGRQRRARMRLL